MTQQHSYAGLSGRLVNMSWRILHHNLVEINDDDDGGNDGNDDDDDDGNELYWWRWLYLKVMIHQNCSEPRLVWTSLSNDDDDDDHSDHDDHVLLLLMITMILYPFLYVNATLCTPTLSVAMAIQIAIMYYVSMNTHSSTWNKCM